MERGTSRNFSNCLKRSRRKGHQQWVTVGGGKSSAVSGHLSAGAYTSRPATAYRCWFIICLSVDSGCLCVHWVCTWVVCVCACVFSHVWLFATSWAVARQAPLSMGCPRQEYWSGLPFPSLKEIFPTQGLNPPLLLGRWILFCWATWEDRNYS